MNELDSIHHVAVPVTNVAEAVDWYRKHFRCEISYQDDTWALLKFANASLALVIPEQHPPHLGVAHPDAARFGALMTHRDGTRSCYVRDAAGNSVEILDAASL